LPGIDARLKAEAQADEGAGLRYADPVAGALGVAGPEIVVAFTADERGHADRWIAIGAALLSQVEAIRRRLAQLEASWNLNPACLTALAGDSRIGEGAP
jgi:hypothetical protein